MLQVGGYAGTVVGLTTLDGQPANRNATTRKMTFARDRWYGVRLRVTAARVQAWIDGTPVVDTPRAGHAFGHLGSWGPIKPFGIYTSRATGAVLRTIRLRRLGPEAEARGEAPKAGKWRSLFDGTSLRGWQAIDQFPRGTGSGKGGRVHVQDGRIVLDKGDPFTGIVWSGEPPTLGYEIAFETMRGSGDGPCLCNVIYPAGSRSCALLLGDSKGALHLGAAKHPSLRMSFQPGRWYAVRLRVTEAKVQLWIDRKLVLEGERLGRAPDLWYRWDPLTPLGIFTTRVKSAVRNIRLRRLE
jgi:hypothetical protein